MILPSNGSSDYFPDNTPSDFTTLLRRPLTVQDDKDYEIAVTELQIVRTVSAVSNDTVIYQKPKRGDVIPAPIEIRIAEKNISSVSVLVQELQKAFVETAPTTRRQGHFVQFSYNAATSKTTVTLVRGHSITLSEELASIFGFDNTEITETRTSEHDSDLNRGGHNLYIFCDQTRDIVFGSGKAGLLGFISIPKGTVGEPEVVTKSFQHPMFVKVVDNRMDRIRIYIRNENDKPAQIGIGPSIVRLSVRRSQS